jgi:hypothetical protein
MATAEKKVASRKSSSTSPTQRSLEYLREQGYYCEIVEYWNPWARVRKDLFGFVDILAIREGEVLAVQVTASGVSSRIKKIQESETVSAVRKSGIRIHVHGWIRQPVNKTRKRVTYKLRIEDIS